MATTCVLQTRVDKETKEKAQKVFAMRGITVSEGLREALYNEIGEKSSAASRLKSVFNEADKKREAAGFTEPTVESIVNFCDSIKEQRAQEISEFKW